MPTSLVIQMASAGGAEEICCGSSSNNSSSSWSTVLCHGHSCSPSSSLNSSSLSSNSLATTDGSGGINGSAGVPPPSGNGGDGGGQQRCIGGHGSGDGSGGGNSSGGNGDNGDSGVDIGGGDDGYAPVAGGSGSPPNWAVEEQQDDANYAEDESGPLAGTFGTLQDFLAEDSIIFPTLGPGLHVLTHPSRHQHALLALSKRHIDGAQWWVGDSSASVHGTGSMDHFYNTRPPTPEESRLIVGTGEMMQVKCIGDLDVGPHCDEDYVVTLREVYFVPGL